MLLKQTDLLRAFKQRLQSASHVDLASAWATEGTPLELLRAARSRGVTVRAIVGTHGNTTTPKALLRLRKIGELRLVGRAGPLFHPKLYLFRGVEDFAWIGSANFTGKGFGQNEELVLETREVDDVAAWFENRWKACGPLKDSQLKAYIESHEEPLGLADHRATRPTVSRLMFASDGMAGRRWQGTCYIERSDGSKSEERYRTHGEAVRLVLRTLTEDWRDESLLDLIEHEGPKRAGEPLLAKREKSVYRIPSHTDDKHFHVAKIKGASRYWWLTPDTDSPHKRELIRFAAEHCGAAVDWDEDSKHGF